MEENIRRRNQNQSSRSTEASSSSKTSDISVDQLISKSKPQLMSVTSKEEKEHIKSYLYGAYTGSYWLTRILFIRCLGGIYFVAFLIALNQNKQLIGANGLLPSNLYLDRLRSHYSYNSNSSYLSLLNTAPTLFWWVSAPDQLDLALDITAYTGLVLSLILILLGAGNVIIFGILWILYQSLCNIGQQWYSFGWESQLLEMGFLAMFMCPVFSLHQFPQHTPTSWPIILGNRWMIFRIMIGAGVIKLRGDQCWRDLTCMNYHYETQPVPNPLSYYFHQSPEAIHMLETAGNHLVEVVLPFLLFLPQPFCAFGGICQILFQIILIISGNLSFLNWLTILPSIYCLDDYMLSYVFPKTSTDKAFQLQKATKEGNIKRPLGFYIRKCVSVSLSILLVYLSIPVVQNLLSSRQLMNASFNSLRIVNTYGAFGSVTKERTEVIIEGTYDDVRLGVDQVTWMELEFNCKPGNISRRPCVISPYHYRLDWLMWFAAFQTYQHNPWLLNLCGKVLAGDHYVNDLVAYNPFKDKPPKFIRASHYKYKYTNITSAEAKGGKWWIRERMTRDYLPIVDKTTLKPVIEQQGWKWFED